MRLLCAQALAFWAVGAWWLRRATDGSDEPWGLVALAAAAWLLKDERPRPLEPDRLLLPALLTLLYAATFHRVPMLVSATLAACALASTAGAALLGRPFVPWLWGLAVLSLPWLSSLQFYLGYPMRVASGELAATLLRMNGLSVHRVGTGLEWAGQTVFVDAPCSGVQMLWAGSLLAVLLAAVHRLDTRSTALLAGAAAVILVLANGLRAAALFYPEAGLLPLPAGAHSGAGVVVFAAAAAALILLARRLEPCPA